MIEKKKTATIHQEPEENPEMPDHIWVFGYGSLIWKPDFPYESSVVGHIEGFVRRFWQGSTWHRGTEDMPGRVVTLEEQPLGRVWGIAYKVSRDHMDTALGRLNKREITLGGYELYNLSFHSDEETEPFPVLLYAATPGNCLYFGKETPEKLALQIVSTRGKSGPNVEYLFRLADFMRDKAPQIQDDHLFNVEKFARRKLGLPTDDMEIAPWTELVKNNSHLRRKLTIA